MRAAVNLHGLPLQAAVTSIRRVRVCCCIAFMCWMRAAVSLHGLPLQVAVTSIFHVLLLY